MIFLLVVTAVHIGIVIGDYEYVISDVEGKY